MSFFSNLRSEASRCATAGCCLALSISAVGCQGKQRAFGPASTAGAAGNDTTITPLSPMEDGGQLEMSDADSLSSGDSGASDPSGVAPLEPGALGSPCVIPEGCDSGYCVAGRCCESACDGLCEACSEAGLCDAVPSDDSRCAPITCGAANLCVEFPEEQADDRCAALGSCKTACDPTYAGTGISCEEVAVDVAGSCDGSGTCTDPRALQGAACGSSRDCRDLSCVDGVCCAEPCDAPCESCDATGACVADPLESGCGDGLQCFGRGACLEPLGAACEADDDCGSGNCELAVGGGSACCAEACPASFRCNGDGQCVSPESDLGAACTTGAQCIGGRCFDGRCCDVACGGVCERCNAPGQEGRCVGAPLGSQEAGCTGARECAGRGQCQLGLGSPCNLNDECRSGTCGAALQGTGEVCCEERCPSGQLCGPSGNCVDAPDPDGSPCTNGGDCISGDCVAGRCCETACNGLCEACSSLGDCNVNPGNDPRCPAVDCPTSNTVCRTFPADITTNLCGGLRSCRTAQSECQARFASAGTACENVAPGVVGRCDGAGNCQDPRVPNGTACNAGSQCTSGNCETPFAGQSNVCCAANCTGSQRCSQNFTSCVDCTPGERRCDPATGAPQRCSNGGQWQNDTACGQGQTCTGAGQCTCVSGQGLTNCGTFCANLSSNADHCGGCGQACFPGQGGTCNAGRCCRAGCANGCFADGSCTCPAGATFEDGTCVCGPNLNLCSDGATISCNNNVFGFEDGTLQGWQAYVGTTSVPSICQDEFATCLLGFTVGNSAAFAHGGSFYASATGGLVQGSVRRLAVSVNLCGGPGSLATTNLVGRTISAFMQTGSQGGSFPGNLFRIAISDGRSPPVTIATTDAATTGGAQNTGWRLVSGTVPDTEVGRAVALAILAIDLPTQNGLSFQMDDIRIGN